METETERDDAIREISAYSNVPFSLALPFLCLPPELILFHSFLLGHFKSHQKEVGEQPQIPGVLRIHNGTSVDSEASYKALYVSSGAKTLEVIKAALDRNGKMKDQPADYLIVIEEDGEGFLSFSSSSDFW